MKYLPPSPLSVPAGSPCSQKLNFVVLTSSALLTPRLALAGNDAFDTNPAATGGVANFSGNFTLSTHIPMAGARARRRTRTPGRIRRPA